MHQQQLPLFMGDI